MALRSYVEAAGAAISQYRGPELINSLALNNHQALTAVFDMRTTSFNQLLAVVEGRLRGLENSQKWAKVLAYHLFGIRGLQTNEMQEAFDNYLKAASAFRDIFDKEADPWLSRPIVVLLKNLRVIADSAHRVARQQGQHSEVMNLAGEEIRRALKSASQGQKAAAVLPIIVILYKLYFKIGNMRLSKELRVMVHSPVESYPLGEQVAFSFFNGVLRVMEENWHEARKELQAAFRDCKPSSPKNKAAILTYLVPVNMLLGTMPREDALQRHRLGYFIPIVRAIRFGNPVALREALLANQFRFIQAGTYLLMEKLYLMAFRTLVKRVHLIQRELFPAAKPSQVHLEHVQSALRALGEEMHVDEIECIVANLITRKYIKAYISHNLHRLVVHQKQPYPPLDQVSLL